MDGSKKTGGWEETLRYLEQAIEEELQSECRDLKVNKRSYKALWKASYAFLSEICEPSPKLVKDAIRLVGNFGKMVDLCRLHEREAYEEQVIHTKIAVDSNGTRSTEVGQVSKEAERPPLPPPNFHPLKFRIVRALMAIAA